MKDLLKSNIYESSDKIVVVGSCLKNMQPKAYEEIEKLNLPIFDVCLEQTHLNMVITKLLGMIRASNMTEIIFATVDKSPHCTQLHYVQNEIHKIGIDVKCTNYVAVNNTLVFIDKDIISLSKNLSELAKRNGENK